MLRQGLIILFMLGVSLVSEATESFTSFKLPSASAPQFPLSIQQDKSGQIWLFADASVSLFTSDEFIQYRRFQLPAEIVAGLLVQDGFLLATSEQLFYSAKANNSAALPIWRSPSEKITGLQQFADKVVITTLTEVYQLDLAQLTSQQPELILAMSEPIIQLQASQTELYVLAQQQLSVHSANNPLRSFNLSQPLEQLAVTSEGIHAINASRELVKVSLLGNTTTMESKGITAERLLKTKDQLFFISANELRQMGSTSSLQLPFVTERIYLDNNANIWLLSPYDVQVNWRQSINLLESANPVLGRFDVYTAKYALKGQNLFLRNGKAHTWQMKLQLPNIANSKQIITTKDAIWFVKSDKLVALDNDSYVQNFELAINSRDLIFNVSENKLMLISAKAMIELDSSGATKVVKTCPQTCLPRFNVNAHLLTDNTVLLATNQGLRQFDRNSLTFTEDRLDRLNSLSPVLSIVADSSSRVWLLYPDKIALFDTVTGTSDIYFSGDNRLFAITKENNDQVFLFSRQGWFEVTRDVQEQAVNEQINLHQVMENNQSIAYVAPESILQLTSTEQELKLAFNLAKRHADQAVYFRFKYQDEPNWSQASQLSQSITLKNLRQGENTLLMQARLEGQDWGQTRQFNYQLPYKYLQTKWVVFYAFVALILAAAIYLYERYKRFKMAFGRMKQQAFINSLLESTKDGVWIANKDREIYSVNQAFCDITGFASEEVMQHSFKITNKDGRDHELESLIWQEVTKAGFWAGEVWSQKKTGEAISIDLSVTRVETSDKLVNIKDVRYVGVFSDVTDRKNSEQALQKLATRDPLTELANRTLCIELIEQAIARANPADPNFALMFIDLDNFSKVNANLGPLQGDELIKQVAQRLTEAVDKAISVARLTGDEFAMLVPNHLLIGEPSFYIRRLVNDIKRKLHTSFLLANAEVNINASFGISLYPQHGHTPEALMRCADTALKKIKQSGKNNFMLYASDLDHGESELLSLESELIRAFDQDEFKVYFQPKYLVQQHFISGYEALVRWDNPTRGIVAPDKFIALAEQNGLIRQLDSAVLKKVCKQIVEWQKQGIFFGKIAVNISALNFQQREFCHTIQNIVLEHNVKPELIELEITESAMMSDPEQTLANLNELRSLGFSIALDDFGTGHSSLGHLKYFPIDRVKIDRSFIKDIEHSEQDKNVTSVIIQLAKHLNMHVIAEGVENQSQAYILHVLGCNEIQGYLISKPLPAEQVLPFLQEQMADLPDIALD